MDFRVWALSESTLDIGYRSCHSSECLDVSSWLKVLVASVMRGKGKADRVDSLLAAYLRRTMNRYWSEKTQDRTDQSKIGENPGFYSVVLASN